MASYEKALYGLFMQAHVWCRPPKHEGFTVHWPEGEDGRLAEQYYLGGIAAMTGIPWHVVGADYRRFVMEVDEPLVAPEDRASLEGRRCVVPPELVDKAMDELDERIK